MHRLAIAAVLALSISAPGAQTPEAQIQCVNGICLVPEPMLEHLAERAGFAERAASLCGWTGFPKP